MTYCMFAKKYFILNIVHETLPAFKVFLLKGQFMQISVDYNSESSSLNIYRRSEYSTGTYMFSVLATGTLLSATMSLGRTTLSSKGVLYPGSSKHGNIRRALFGRS